MLALVTLFSEDEYFWGLLDVDELAKLGSAIELAVSIADKKIDIPGFNHICVSNWLWLRLTK